jgi:hypothetical protein
MLPPASTETPRGWLKRAIATGPSNAPPDSGAPVTVVTTPAGVTLRIALLPLSAT